MWGKKNSLVWFHLGCIMCYLWAKESCRLSHSDANWTHPLKSSLPSVLVNLPPQQEQMVNVTKVENILVQAATIIKPHTLVGQIRGREEEPSFCIHRCLLCLLPSLKSVISSNAPVAKTIGPVAYCTFNALSYIKYYQWIKIVNHELNQVNNW